MCPPFIIISIIKKKSSSCFRAGKNTIMAEERGTVHSRLRDKRTKKQELFSNKAEEDRISALPDSLLLHIMSFLSTKEVVKTCLLSQRWQFLWTNISEIDLDEDYSDHSNKRFFVDCVGKLLLMCGGTYLTKFAVSFYYDECFASDVDTWLQFAVKNKVENIELYFEPDDDLYRLPQILYSHSYLTSLRVGHCDMAPRVAIKWRSLKSLYIDTVGLDECVMEKILSGCPVLEVLHLKQCWGLKCLNISSPSLAILVIENWVVETEENISLAILAPYVLDLSIIGLSFLGYIIGYDFRLLNVSSVVRAKICFDSSVIENASDQMKQLLESLKSVKELELGPWCIEVLSVLEVKGWQFPSSTRSCLTLEAGCDKRSIPGILGILKSSPNLETLVIKGEPPHFKETEPEIDAYLQNLELVAFHVKTVKITSFTESSCSVELMVTLVQILLKRATVLEKMVISAKELDTNKLAITLISFPRASPKAVIVFD